MPVRRTSKHGLRQQARPRRAHQCSGDERLHHAEAEHHHRLYGDSLRLFQQKGTETCVRGRAVKCTVPCLCEKTKFGAETVYNTRRGWGCVGRENIGGRERSSLRRRRRSPGRQPHGYVCWPPPQAAPAARCRSRIPKTHLMWCWRILVQRKRAGAADEMRDQLEARTAGSSCGTEHGCSRTRGSASSDRARPYGLAQRPARRARAGTPRKSEAPARLQWGGERHRARRERLRTLAMDDVQAEHAIFRACAGSQLAHASSVTRPRGSMSLLFRALTRLHFVAGAGSVDSAAAAPLAPG